MATMVRTTFETPAGRFGVLVTEAGVRAVLLPSSKLRCSTPRAADPAAEAVAAHAATELREYLDCERQAFDFPLDWSLAGGAQRVVLETLRDIAPYGHVVTYGGNLRYNKFDLSLAPLADSRTEGGAYIQDEIFLSKMFRWVVGGQSGSSTSPAAHPSGRPFGPPQDEVFRVDLRP